MFSVAASWDFFLRGRIATEVLLILFCKPTGRFSLEACDVSDLRARAWEFGQRDTRQREQEGDGARGLVRLRRGPRRGQKRLGTGVPFEAALSDACAPKARGIYCLG